MVVAYNLGEEIAASIPRICSKAAPGVLTSRQDTFQKTESSY
jgi:hypothetical protein